MPERLNIISSREAHEHKIEVMVTEAILKPEPHLWWSATLADRPDPLASIRRQTRLSIGLDPDRPVLATGHQAQIWHPGILAKDLSLAAASEVHEDLQTVHFIADHDANDGGLISLPSGSGPSLQRLEWRALPSAQGLCARDRPAGMASSPPAGEFLPSVLAGIDSIREALEAHRDAESLAMQIGAATASLAAPFTGSIPRRSMSGLLESPIGEWLLDRLMSDPTAAARSHDVAIEAHRNHRAKDRGGRTPRAVARLLGQGPRLELPLWRSTPDGRVPVFADEKIEPGELRPRAMLATALCRLGACDGFVHGLGGAIYDEAMELWISNWLGGDIAGSLAPAFVATATCRLPLVAPIFDREADPTFLHRLRNDPDLGSEGSGRRDELLAAITEAPRRSLARRQAYLRLRARVQAAREDQAARLEAVEARVRAQADSQSSSMIAEDRTWAFPLHEARALKTLGSSIRASFTSV